jgi:anaerobic selenocysteine-containing dehydrogenase
MAKKHLPPGTKIPGAATGITTCNSFCDICSPGPNCGVTCYVKDGEIIKIEGMADHPISHGLLCTKGLAGRQYVYREDRILTPLRRVGARGEGKFQPITWEEAWTEITARLNQIKGTYGPSSVAFYSGYNKWYRPFLQRLCYSFGSVNYGTESCSCFTSTIMSWRVATGQSFAGPDLKHAGLFLGWCYNGYDSSYLMPQGVARNRARGMKVIIIDPRITSAVEKQCDLHLRINPGTDCALALCLGRELIQNGWVDEAYIRENVFGYEEYRSYVMDFTPERVEQITDVPAAQIRLAARMIHENGPLAINQSGAALVHHTNGMQTHRAVMALSALTGSYDRPGGMIPAPLTYAHSMAGFETRSEEFPFEQYPKDQPRPVGAQRFPLWDRLVGEMQGNDLARQIKEGTPYPVRALWAHGMNYRMFNGDRELEQALKSLDFFVDIDLFLTDTAKLADLVLPCCTSFERSEFKVYGGGYAQWTQQVITPLGESRRDDEICCELARRLNLDDDLLKAGPEACIRHMLRDTPIDVDALKAHPQSPQKIVDLKKIPVGQHPFCTPSGKFELWSNTIAEIPGLDPLPTYRDSLDRADPAQFPLCLVSGARLPNALHSRLHDVPWVRALRPQPMADINDRDAESLGIKSGDPIRLETSAGAITVLANPTLRVKQGTVFFYHGYQEADVNAIVPPGHNDPYSGFPGYRSVRCRITPVKGGEP